jgi:hypothetical protein
MFRRSALALVALEGLTFRRPRNRSIEAIHVPEYGFGCTVHLSRYPGRPIQKRTLFHNPFIDSFRLLSAASRTARCSYKNNFLKATLPTT